MKKYKHKNVNDSEAFIEYLHVRDDIYENIEEYNSEYHFSY